MTEHKTLVGKLLEIIFSTFKKKWPVFVAGLFKKVPQDVKDKITIGIMIVEKLKDWTDEPIFDFIVSVIPGDKDDKILEGLRKYLTAFTEISKYDFFDGGDRHLVASKINSEITGLSLGQSALTTEVVYNGLKAEGKL